jgi:hypothetical protein
MVLDFSIVLFIQKFADALFQRRQIIRDAPRHLCPFVVSSMPLIRSGAVSNLMDLSREGFVERILYRRALLRGQVKRAAHERGLGRCFQGLGEAFFASRPSLAGGG